MFSRGYIHTKYDKRHYRKNRRRAYVNFWSWTVIRILLCGDYLPLQKTAKSTNKTVMGELRLQCVTYALYLILMTLVVPEILKQPK